MRFFRLWLSGVSACCLAFSLPFVSYASVATSSEAVPVASGSNARPATPSEPLPMDPDLLEDRFDTLDPPVLTSDGDSGYGVDWYYTGVWRSSSSTEFINGYLGNDGFYHFRSPGSGYKLIQFRLVLKSSALPSSGDYGFSAEIKHGNVDVALQKVRSFLSLSQENVEDFYSPDQDIDGSNNGEVYHASCNVKIPSSADLFTIVFVLEEPEIAFDLGAPSWSFWLSTDPALPDVDTGIPSNPSQDMANGIEQQVQQGDTIIELIKNTIQTISSQLTAFWNQLAGEFTNLYNKMTAEHAEDLAKVDEQIEADRQNTDDIIANQNQNTNTITNGYDSSALDQSSNALNDKLTEYDKIESGIHDSASSWISDFTLPDFDNLIDSGGILAACVWLGSFWQNLFTQMGAFNIPVTLSLSLVFVLMLVGYHRFRR